MDEGQAHALADRIAAAAGYVVDDVRRAWSAAWAWQVGVVARTDARTDAPLPRPLGRPPR